ncbi:hypothetical protein AB1Y20_003682 [Prymnesium parvum]|uniref:Uncharacterized protein n=1 Tax=Prymnesium parvum TaxID=97485 RepID=A0AB34J5F7_PRYPA
MPPRRPHAQDAAPNRALDAARSGLQHLQEQERMLTTKCLPRDNPVEAAFKAPDPLPHSYAPRPPVSRSSAGAPVPLRIPQALTAISASPGEYAAPEDVSSGGAVSYSKVRRWEVLPKHAWLQAAESGHGPGPGFRDVSATQTLRSFGPKQLEEPAPAEGSVIEEAPASSKPQATLGMSATVGQHYTPSAKGLVPATLMAALAEGLPEVAEEDEEDESAEQEAVMLSTFSPETTTATDAEVASSFLPLAFFDSEDMESMADTVWPSIEESFNSGHPYMARSRYHGADGKVSMFECDVVRYLPEEAKFEIQWIHNGRRKTVTRLNLLFDDELESKFTERVHETIDGNSLTTSDAVLNELHFKKRTVGSDEARLTPARWQGKAAQQSLAELRTEYVAAMKLATLNYEMLSAPFRNKIKPLKLPRPKVKPVPEQGCVVLPETETKDARKCMQDNLFHADATLLACTRMVFDESYWMRDTLLLSTRLDYLDPPSSLSNFVTVQSSTLDSVRTKLLTSWVPGVESIVHQELGTLPEFEHAMDEKQFLESRIPRFLKQIGLLMQDELQLMVLESMRAYLELLNLFATPQAELHKKPEEWVHALPNADPALLSITLKLKDGMLLYEPSLEQVAEKLKQCLEAFVDQTDNIPQIGNKGMRSYTLPEQTLNTLRKDDRQLVGARVDLEQLLDASLMRPRQLLELYQA